MADPVVNKIGIPISDYTEAKVDGNGVFDVIMRSVLSQLNTHFDDNRLSGDNLAKVCIGLVEASQKIALDFLIQRDEAALKAKLLEIQLQIAGIEKDKAAIELTKAGVELQMLELQKDKIPHEIQLLIAQTGLVNNQAANQLLEGKLLVAQECKTRAEYDLIIKQIAKTEQENLLLAAKTATEKAQIDGTGVQPNSVIGKQLSLMQAQTDGFARDAEQKLLKAMLDTWNVRRTTDEGTIADDTNKLSDANIGRIVAKAYTGVGA